MLDIVIPNAVPVYKQIKRLISETPTLGRVRIGMTNTDMTLTCENDIDVSKIRAVLEVSRILGEDKEEPKPKHIEDLNPKKHIEELNPKKHIYNPAPKVSKRKGK
jgi:hypothetical protein